MNKSVKIEVAIAGLFAVTGFSVAEVPEYLQVARNRASTAIRESIPLGVEIDRMEVLIGKLDQQVATQKYAVARSKITLQDAQAEYARRQSRCQHLLPEMKQLRGLETSEESLIATLSCSEMFRPAMSSEPCSTS